MLICISAPLRETQAAAPAKPNVVYIMADDLRQGDLSLNGGNHFNHRTFKGQGPVSSWHNLRTVDDSKVVP